MTQEVPAWHEEDLYSEVGTALEQLWSLPLWRIPNPPGCIPVPWQGDGLGDLQRSLQTWQFCDSVTPEFIFGLFSQCRPSEWMWAWILWTSTWWQNWEFRVHFGCILTDHWGWGGCCKLGEESFWWRQQKCKTTPTNVSVLTFLSDNLLMPQDEKSHF